MSAAGLSITACLQEVSARLVDAAAVSRAALACAEAGSEREALQIVMDLDTLLYEAKTLHGAVCLIGRITHAEDRRRMPGD